MAFNKPPGQHVITLGGDYEILYRTLRRNFPPGVNHCHRIDRFTSGVVIAARNSKINGYMHRCWFDVVHKNYLAIIPRPYWKDIILDMPLAGLSAKTGFEILDTWKSYALVRCQLLGSGRTNQIRRHLKSGLRVPIINDLPFKGDPSPYPVRAGQLLHAWRVEFQLPNERFMPSGEKVRVQAPVPEDFRQFGFDWEAVSAGDSPVLESYPILKVKGAGNGSTSSQSDD